MRNRAQSDRDCTSCPQPTWFFRQRKNRRPGGIKHGKRSADSAQKAEL